MVADVKAVVRDNVAVQAREEKLKIDRFPFAGDEAGKRSLARTRFGNGSLRRPRPGKTGHSHRRQQPECKGTLAHGDTSFFFAFSHCYLSSFSHRRHFALGIEHDASYQNYAQATELQNLPATMAR